MHVKKKVTHRYCYYSLSSWNILAGQLLYITYNLNKLQVSEKKIAICISLLMFGDVHIILQLILVQAGNVYFLLFGRRRFQNPNQNLKCIVITSGLSYDP